MSNKKPFFDDPRCMRCDTPLQLTNEIDEDEFESKEYLCPHCGTIHIFYGCSEEEKENYEYYNDDIEDNIGGCSHGYDGLCPQCGSHIVWGSDFMRSEVLCDVDGPLDEYGCFKDDALASSVHCPHCGASIDVIECKPSEYHLYPAFADENNSEENENDNE